MQSKQIEKPERIFETSPENRGTRGNEPDTEINVRTIDISRIALIGAGGVGGFITLHLGLLTNCEAVLICDGDEFERKNTARQGMAVDKIGQNKAEIAANCIRNTGCKPCSTMDEFLTESSLPTLLGFEPTLIISAVDNDKAREIIFGLNAEYDILWGANELWTPQAGISRKEKPWNPLTAFTAAENAGTACGIQTVHANACAASMAMMLLNMHASEHESFEKLPVFLSKQGNEQLFQMFPNEL